MSRNVIASLNEWKRKRPANEWTKVQDFEQKVQSLDKPTLAAIWREVERCVRQGTADSVPAMEWDWKPEITPIAPDAMARCRVVTLDGAEAECMVFLDGFELPRVSFPAWILKQKGLGVGGRFIWIMRDGSRVRPADIDSEIPQTDDLTNAERAELDRLYDKFQRRRAEDGGEWPEYTGSGR